MTISSTNNRNDYTGNDTTAIYNYSFRVFLESDLTVTVRNTTTDVETELSLTTDYTVQDVGELSGGTITLVDAGQDWISGTSNLDTGYKLTIRRIVGLTQNTDIRNQGDFFPEVHEDAFDRLTMTDQQQQDDLDRAIKLPETIASSEFDTTIPADFVGTQSLALVSNATGDGFATGPSISAIEGAQAAATAAAASAAAAATSETNAATSETNAGTSETNAATSETNAAASAAAASTSETNAATSASNAATSETNAGTSETNAAASAAAASTSETNAATSASNAATSETNAATSASNAATSETNAATSATNAATSEANAAASATAAQDAAAASQWKDVVYITNVDSPVSITDADSGKLYSVNTSGGNVVFNLPAISGLTLSAPWSIGVKKTDTSANTVTINPNGTDVIDGNASATISQAETGLVVIPDADPAPDEWTTLIFGEVPSVFEGKTFNDEITMKEIATPSAPAAGFQAIFMDSGDNKLKRIDSNGDVFGVGGGAGDADTIHLIKASDQGASQITQYSVDSVLPDFDGTSAFGANEGDISVPTSGSEALLSNDDDHKVYKYTAESASQYSAYGMNLNMPRYVRGEDVVLQFKYRTADTSGDSANGDYMVWVFDQTSGVNTTFNDTPGTFSAGTSITVTTSTGMSVGDKIWVEQASNVVETHITAITDSTHVTLADDVTCGSGDRFITGILTDVLTTLDAADDDTNKTGTDYKVVFNVPSDCAQVTVMFQQLTSQTDSFLYLDNILVSSEVVKRVFAKKDSFYYHADTHAGYGSTNNKIPYFTNVNTTTTTKYGTIANDSTYGWSFTASQKCKVNISYSADRAAGTAILGITKNSAALTTSIGSITGVTKLAEAYTSGAGSSMNVSTETVLNSGDVIRPHTNGDALNSTTFVMTVTPEVNDVVVVESTDSVISEWVSETSTIGATTSAPTKGTVTRDQMCWRRVGDTMEIQFNYEQSAGGTAGSGQYLVEIPSGYIADVTGVFTQSSPEDEFVIGYGSFGVPDGSSSSTFPCKVSLYSSTQFKVSGVDVTSANAWIGWGSSNYPLSAAVNISVFLKVKIAGWDANPKPLLALPTVTYGQDAEYFNSGLVTDFWDSTALSDTFNESLITGLSDSLLLSVVNAGGDDRITATQDIVLHISVSGSAMNAGQRVEIYDYNNKLIAYGTGDASVTSNDSASGTVRLNAGQYVWVRRETASSRTGGISLTAMPLHGVTNQAAIIAQPVAILQERQPLNTPSSTSFSAGSHVTNVLNTLKGEIAEVGVTLSSNQFTLPSGRYLIEAEVPIFCNNSTGVSYQAKSDIYNVTDSVVVEDSKAWNARNSGTTSGHIDTAFLSVEAVITVTKDTAFTIRTRLSDVTGGPSCGVPVNFGQAEVYTTVKITRKK